MASDQGNFNRTAGFGRGFASMDPERRGVIAGFARPVEPVREPQRPAAPTWGRALPADRDAGMDEGGSGRRGR